jgi:hypothetical protein
MRASTAAGPTRRRFLQAAAAGIAFASPANAFPSLLPQTGDGPGEGAGGTRVVWVGGAASIPGVREQLEPAVDGMWENTRTGERYDPFETPGAGGAGYVVLDVLHAGSSGFVLWKTSLLLHGDFGGATSFIDADGVVAAPDAVEDFWIDPAVLAGLPEQDGPGLRILRMPYDLGGRRFDAIAIRTSDGSGASQRFYDLESGVCLATSSSVRGAPVLTLGADNQLESGPGSTQVSFTRLAGTRQVALPGFGEVYPEHVRRLGSLVYQGTKSAVVSGASTFQLPITLRYDLGRNAGTHVGARVSGTGIDLPIDRTIPAGVIGSLWMNPDELAGYGSDRLLDRDPTTGVEAVAAGRVDGLSLVQLRTPLAQQTFGYDLGNGLLVAAELRSQIGLATDVVAVRLADVR